ncbi:hypothetical protein [Altererythrobacter xiamenensis]|uniref:hypothetical protein n=1 Tax=Altererythrobacter xiamenensis TaxID=1316679 RepID=UPI000A39357B|nr:hypothetical protein [Altererythrobacter xiamenensis]
MLKVLIASTALLTTLPATAQDRLSLICEGAFRGEFKDRGVSGAVITPEGKVYSGGSASSEYGDIPTIALFELKEGEARLNLPQPPTCSICVGEKGWRDVKDLNISEDEIEGRIRYGLFSGTKFLIDRRTGIMTGDNGFTGMCRAQDLSERKF